MIVRNEEAMLAQCLESVKGADEIVIVDTGSTDKTVEIALMATNKVYSFQWCDDFSAARNFARESCTGDWIISIDADEVMEEGGIEKIRDFISTFDGNAVGIRMQSGDFKFYVPRLFRNTPEIFWIGKIHELINSIADQNIEVGITFGSSPAHTLDPDRNIRILQQVIDSEPENTRALYYLGRELGYRKDWLNAIKYLEIYLHIATWLPERADAFFMLAVAYWNIQQGEVARRNALCAININANFKAAIKLMGHMSFEKNKIQWDRMAETATNEDTLFARDNFLTI